MPPDTYDNVAVAISLKMSSKGLVNLCLFFVSRILAFQDSYRVGTAARGYELWTGKAQATFNGRTLD